MPVDGFDERLLLHTDQGVSRRITLFAAMESALVAVLAIVWQHDLGVVVVCVIALALTAVMIYPLIRLAYGLQNLQQWIASGRVYASRQQFYAAYLALGDDSLCKQGCELKGSKKVYVVFIPLSIAFLWFLTGVLRIGAWAGTSGILPSK